MQPGLADPDPAPIPLARRRPRQIVIAGCGSGGFAAARALTNALGGRDRVHITLVNSTSFMLHQPLLPGVTGATLAPQHIVVPLREALPEAELLVGRVAHVERDQRRLEVTTAAGPRTLRYDLLLIGWGSTSKVMPVPGLTEYATGLKTLSDAIAIRNRVVNHMEKAELTQDPDELDSLLSFVVVGGGYAGVETIAALQDFARVVSRRYPRTRNHGMRWTLVESKPRVMRELPHDMSEFAAREMRRRGIDVYCGMKVVHIEEHSVRLSDGGSLPCGTVVWTAGVVPPPVTRRIGLPMNGKRIHTDVSLRVNGQDSIWAIGDTAAIPRLDGPDDLCPPTAQYAVRQGKAVARNLLAELGIGSPGDFRYRERGIVVDMGRGQAVARIGGRRWRGPPAFLMGRGLHAASMPGTRRTMRLMSDWAIDAVFGRVGLDLGDLGPQEPLVPETEHDALAA